MIDVDLLVFGSGSLARALVTTLATRLQPSLSIMIAGRSQAALDSILLLARTRAAALDGELLISSSICDFSEAALEALFLRVRPRIVLVLASLQSPWHMGTRWRRLIQAVGYGFTLPFQAALVDTVFRLSQLHHPSGFRVNGCYPDLVNRVLTDRGLIVTGGIGNIAILASLLRSMYPNRVVQVLAHHAHIAALIRGRWDRLPPPWIWLDRQRLTDAECAALPGRVSLPGDDTLNGVTGAAAIPMLQSLAGLSPPWNGHSPGVNGLLGGYPVSADERGLHLALPSGVTAEQALAANRRFGYFDGVSLKNGYYHLTRTPDEIECATGIRVPASLLTWHPSALSEQIAQLEAFRSTLDPHISFETSET
jgi:hypothetical protein